MFAYISNPNPSDLPRNSGRASTSSSRRGSCSPSPRAPGPPGATLLAAVGPLQFEVVQYRLKSEYGAESRLEMTPWTTILPVDRSPTPPLRNLLRPDRRVSGVSFGSDKLDQPRRAFPWNDWTMRYFVEKNPELKLREPRSSSRRRRLHDVAGAGNLSCHRGGPRFPLAMSS